MPLVTLADLNGPPLEVARRFEDAKRLASLYDEFLETQPDDSVRPPGIHASEVVRCLRQAYYTLTGHRKRHLAPKRWKQRLKVGRVLHRMWQDDFEAMSRRTFALRAAKAFADEARLYLEFQPEVLLSPELQPIANRLRIHSRCDGLFTFREAPHGPAVLRVLFEGKSESPDEYEQLRKPKAEHVEQAHVYMAVLDVPVTWFFYFAKGNHNNTKSVPPFLACFDPPVWKRVEEKHHLVLDYAERRTPPPRQETIACEFCPYSWDCQPAHLTKKMRQEPVVRLHGTDRH